jgi:hypothetical protein
MIEQEEVSKFRQWGMQTIDSAPVLPLNLITLECVQYQFLDCFNGSNKPSDYWEQHSVRPDDAEEDDRERHVTFLACPLGPLVYDPEFMDGEYPVGTVQHVYYKPKEYRHIQRIFDSLVIQEKDAYDVAHRLNTYAEKATIHLHILGVYYIYQRATLGKALGTQGTKEMLNVMMSTQQEPENEVDIRFCFIMLPVQELLSAIYMTVETA